MDHTVVPHDGLTQRLGFAEEMQWTVKTVIVFLNGVCFKVSVGVVLSSSMRNKKTKWEIHLSFLPPPHTPGLSQLKAGLFNIELSMFSFNIKHVFHFQKVTRFYFQCCINLINFLLHTHLSLDLEQASCRGPCTSSSAGECCPSTIINMFTMASAPLLSALLFFDTQCEPVYSNTQVAAVEEDHVC